MGHRLFALLAFAVLLVLALALRAHAPLRPQAHALLALCALQLATGLSNVVLGWPLLAAVLHTGGAAAMALVLTWALCASRRAEPQHQALRDADARRSAQPHTTQEARA